MSVFYLGQFPPPFGGVTVKNALVYQALSEVLPVERLEFRKSDSLAIVFRVLFSSRHDVFVVGFGNAQLQKGFIMALNLLRPSVLGRLVVMAMGGKIAEEIVCDDAYERACKRLAHIFRNREHGGSGARGWYDECPAVPQLQVEAEGSFGSTTEFGLTEDGVLLSH